MKKSITILLAMLTIFAAIGVASAEISKEGYIRDMPDVVYKHFIVSKDGLIVTLVNKSDKEIKFEAGISFLNEKRKEVATAFVPATIIPAHGKAQLRNLAIIGDYNVAKKAASIFWNVY